MQIAHTVYKIVSHTAILLLSYCIIIVSGKYTAGLFIQNVLGALNEGALFSIFGTIGVVVLILVYLVKLGRPRNKKVVILNIIGIILLQSSVVMFFANAPYPNVSETFANPLGLISLLQFALISGFWLISQKR